MIVVADSSPLVVLVTIGHVDVLPALFGKVVIPPEVATELAAPARAQAVRAFIATPPGWLEVRPPTAVAAIPRLHAGEVAAIALARELHADRLIVDERDARKAAVERQVQVVGTVGVLELAADTGLIDLRQAFEEVKKTDFWVSPKFLDERLALFQQRKQAQELARTRQEPQAPKPESPKDPEPPKPDLKHGRGHRRGM